MSDEKLMESSIGNLSDAELQLEVYKLTMKENIFTILATVVCVAAIALGTGSLHCLWGLLILLYLSSAQQVKNIVKD